MGCHPNPIDELHHFSRWLLHHQPDIDILRMIKHHQPRGNKLGRSARDFGRGMDLSDRRACDICQARISTPWNWAWGASHDFLNYYIYILLSLNCIITYYINCYFLLFLTGAFGMMGEHTTVPYPPLFLILEFDIGHTGTGDLGRHEPRQSLWRSRLQRRRFDAASGAAEMWWAYGYGMVWMYGYGMVGPCLS